MAISRPKETFAAAAVVGASTLVPLPLLDDWMAARSRKKLCAAMLNHHGRRFAVSDLEALYENGGSLLGLPWRVAKAIILAPINKILKKVLVVFAARDLALAVGKTIALGHTLDRQLASGAFANDRSPQERRADAARLRKALDEALAGVDARVLQRVVAAVVARARNQSPANDAEAQGGVTGLLAEIDRRVDQGLSRAR